MEVRAQAFAFSTNDEVNNMTFYNYVLINQGTQTLSETYFGVWVDADVGTATDDYVGCDVQRGLGYATTVMQMTSLLPLLRVMVRTHRLLVWTSLRGLTKMKIPLTIH